MRFPGKIKPKRNTKALVEFIDVLPTVLDFVGLPTPANVQGKSLVSLLTGTTRQHRDRVFIEYSENEEGYLITDRWKFIYGTGKRLREDGYATGRPLPGRTIQLYDLRNDPEEAKNLATLTKYAHLVADCTTQLADHLKRTARQPELIPKTADVHTMLEFCLQPRDLAPVKTSN
jgi:choline-sulfatase